MDVLTYFESCKWRKEGRRYVFLGSLHELREELCIRILQPNNAGIGRRDSEEELARQKVFHKEFPRDSREGIDD